MITVRKAYKTIFDKAKKDKLREIKSK